MDATLIYKAQLNDLTEEALRQYLTSREEFALDYNEHHRYIDIEDQLINRSVIQEVLEKTPAAFTPSELRGLESADRYVLDHAENAAVWIRNLIGEPEEPRSHWWWYLDLIADEVMPAPDLDEIYSPLIEKAGRKFAKAF